MIHARAGASGRVPPTAPVWLFRALAAMSAPLARTFRFKPLVAPRHASFLLWDAHVDATKAKRELGYAPVPVEEGVDRTIAFLRAQGLVARSRDGVAPVDDAKLDERVRVA